MITENYVRADRPDPENEPLLTALVDRFQIHLCVTSIYRGPGAGRDGKCLKSFPAEVSNRTYH